MVCPEEIGGGGGLTGAQLAKNFTSRDTVLSCRSFL